MAPPNNVVFHAGACLSFDERCKERHQPLNGSFVAGKATPLWTLAIVTMLTAGMFLNPQHAIGALDTADVDVLLSIETYGVFVLHSDHTDVWEVDLGTVASSHFSSDAPEHKQGDSLWFTVKTNTAGTIKCPLEVTLELYDPATPGVYHEVDAFLTVGASHFESTQDDYHVYLEVSVGGDYSTDNNPKGKPVWVTLGVTTADGKKWTAEDIAGKYKGTLVLEFSSSSS